VPATGPLSVIGVIADPEQIVCGPRLDPQPLILLVVDVPTVVQLAVLAVPRIQPEAITTLLHLTSHNTELSKKGPPAASIKKENGALFAGTSADGVGGGFCP
jgi:hypothetical protein